MYRTKAELPESNIKLKQNLLNPKGAAGIIPVAFLGCSWAFYRQGKDVRKNERMDRQAMRWVYFNKLYRTKFQAGCLARRLEQDGWIYGFDDMREIEIFRSRKGKYGVRFIP